MAQQYTRAELKDMAQQAEEAGDTKSAKELSELYWNTPETPDIMADLPAPLRFLDDMTNVSTDSFTRGFGGRHDATRASRERLPWYAEAPADIAGSIVGSPYKVAGKLGAGIAGGVEGAVDAYGHQDSWVPDPWNIAKGAVVGSGVGTAGAKLGDMVGGLWGRARAKADQLFKNDDELTRAADDAYSADPGSRRSQNLTSRADRVAEVRAAQGQDRGTFGKMLEGMPAPAAERAAIDAITNKIPGKINRGVQFAGKVADKVFPPALRGPAVLAESVFTGAPWTTALTAGGTALTAAMGRGAQRRASKVGAREIDDLLAQMRDPTGKGYVINQQTTDAAREILAKLGIGAGKVAAN